MYGCGTYSNLFLDLDNCRAWHILRFEVHIAQHGGMSVLQKEDQTVREWAVREWGL